MKQYAITNLMDSNRQRALDCRARLHALKSMMGKTSVKDLLFGEDGIVATYEEMYRDMEQGEQYRQRYEMFRAHAECKTER